jgi:hypothetical protein
MLFQLDIRPRVEEVMATLSEDEQEEVLRVLFLLQVDPSIDGICRHGIQTPLGMLQFYDGQGVWVSYHMTANDVVSVINCGRYEPRPIAMM